jgi:GntR family transcriptional regulator
MRRKPDQPKTSRYRDIAAEVQKEIRLGTYEVGNLLPTETELMARYAASRQTVREALRLVTEQGLIVRRAGLGSVVIAAEPPVLFTHSVKSLTEWLRYSNETYRQVVRSSEIVADRKLAALLKCEPGKHCSTPRLDRDLCLAEICRRRRPARSRPDTRA